MCFLLLLREYVVVCISEIHVAMYMHPVSYRWSTFLMGKFLCQRRVVSGRDPCIVPFGS